MPPLSQMLILCVWGALAGGISMTLYAKLSPQNKIADLKKDIKVLQRGMLDADIEFQELMSNSAKSLKLSFKLVGIVLLPVIVSAIPIVLLLSWFYSKELYAAGWEWPFFISLFIVALVMKIAFRIE